MNLEPAQLWDWIQTGCVIVTGSTLATMVTRSRSAHPALDWILRLLNVVAGNVGRNRNADADEIPPRTMRAPDYWGLPLLVLGGSLFWLLSCASVPQVSPDECKVLIEQANLPFLICARKTDRQELERCYKYATAASDFVRAACNFVPPEPPAEDTE